MAEQDNTQQQAGAQPAAAQQPQQQQQRQPRQARPCPRDCTMCGYQQHAFCAARMSFQMFEVMNAVIQRLDIQSQRMAALEERVAAIQSSEAEFSSPLPVDGDLFSEHA